MAAAFYFMLPVMIGAVGFLAAAGPPRIMFRHTRALRHIADMEIEMGIDPPWALERRVSYDITGGGGPWYAMPPDERAFRKAISR